MKKRIFSLLTLFAALTTGSLAQQRVIGSSYTEQETLLQEKIIKNCGSTRSSEKWEQWMQQKIAELKASPNRQSIERQNYVIPVVFHILHNGETVGTGKNILAARVYEQIDRINLDFSKTNADITTVPAIFQAVAADFGITFCAAKVDSGGNTLNEAGINRIPISTKGLKPFPWDMDYMDTVVKPLTIWNPEQYLNIWVYTPESGLLGYGTFPPNSGLDGVFSDIEGTKTTDGIAINYLFLGSNTTVESNGRTATHEIGHWLGLRHIWGDDSCATDYCADTPPQETYNFGCKTHPHKVGACNGNTTGEMFMDYMDYSDDNCLKMFTLDQKTRAVIALNVSPMRKALIRSTTCNNGANLPPKVDFYANKTNLKPGDAINFYDLSLNPPSSWLWTFDGGTPAQSTKQHPTGIKYLNGGVYNVKLVARNAYGTDSLIKSLYIKVEKITNTCDTLKNYKGTSSNYTTYVFDYTFPIDSGYISGTNLDKDKVIAEKYLDISAGKKLTGVNFYFGKVKAGNANSVLKINVWSSDINGEPSTVLASKSVLIASIPTKKMFNVQFNSAIEVNAPFFVGFEVPDAAKGDTIAVSTSRINAGVEGLGWIQTESGVWGSYDDFYGSILINNIIFPVFCPLSSGVTANELDQFVTIYPNPATGIFNVDVALSTSDKLNIEVLNLLGEVVISNYQPNTTGGRFSLDLSNHAAGCYFVKVSNSSSSTTQRIIINK